MMSNKFMLLLSSIAIIIFLYVFITSGAASFTYINLGLFIIFIVSFIVSLVKEIKDRK